MSELNITTSQIQGEIPVTILHLSGHLHGTTEAELLDRARQAREDGAEHLLLDLSGVEVLTSAGLRAIHNIFNLFTPQTDRALIKQHGEEPYKSPYFKLVCPNPNVYYVLNIAGFLQNILIYNNMDDAVNSFAT
ncbi:MAG TPA: STAS domain-containing protein [Anaerolineales bacterium]|jgi:anti-anti-sigma factor|nr:STAS domain-containing protein [Anaerolineales bacterium]